MAFWAVYGKPWFKRNIPNQIELFKKYLYDEWFNSLSPDEQEKVLEEKKIRAQQAELILSLMETTVELGKKLGYPF